MRQQLGSGRCLQVGNDERVIAKQGPEAREQWRREE